MSADVFLSVTELVVLSKHTTFDNDAFVLSISLHKTSIANFKVGKTKVLFC